MEIKYKNTLDDKLIEASKIQWRHAHKKSVQTLLLSLLLSVGLLVWSSLSINTSGFWNLKSSIGVAFGILTFIYTVNLYESRSQWLLNCTKAIANKNKNLIEYIFTEEKITVKEINAYAESGWDIITGYRIHDNFLFLYINSSQSSYFTIDSNDLAEADFTNLVRFVSNKIPVKN